MQKKPLKILHLAPANYTGTLDQLVEEHRRRGHIADFVTLTRSSEGFDDGICFDLWPNANHKSLLSFRDLMVPNANLRGEKTELPGTPPFFNPSGMHSFFLKLQDRLYQKRIQRIIEEHDLLNYDIYHLESGIDFFKNYRYLPQLKKQGKKLLTHYHGGDFRNHGVHPVVHQLADANTTCEWDVFFRYPGSRYVYLPVRFSDEFVTEQPEKQLVITHMVRSKSLFYYKGTEAIIKAAQEAIKGKNAEFRLVQGLSHQEAMNQLKETHILIDQIGGKAGWGYGMGAIEALSKGIVVCVEIQPEIEGVLKDHPFVNVNAQTLTAELRRIIDNTEERRERSLRGRLWAQKTHSIQGVIDQYYAIYKNDLNIPNLG